MKNPKNINANFIKAIIIGLVICVIILYVVLIIMSEKEFGSNESIRQFQYINDSKAWNEEEYPFAAYMLFMEYDGELKTDNVVKSMSYVANMVIPKYYLKLRNASEKEISKYYSINSKAIRFDIGLEDEEDFKKLIKSVQNLKSDQLVFESYRINENKIVKFNRYIQTQLLIKYKDNEAIAFNIKVYNKQKDNISSVVYEFAR